MSAATPYRPSRTDALGILVFMVVGAGILIWTAIGSAARIMQVLLGEDVPVTARFIDTRVEAPIGPGGSPVPVELDTAILTPEELPGASVVAALLEPAVLLATVATVIVCLLILARNILRGRVFSRGNTVLVSVAGITGLVGFALVPMLGNMVANGAVARMSDYGFENTAVLAVEPFPFIIAAFVFAIVATAFTVGHRLQRDTEGLV